MGATYPLEFARSGQAFTCAQGENVPDAAYAAGLSPLSSCGQGLCGTRRTSRLSGTVDMRHNGGIRPHGNARTRCC